MEISALFDKKVLEAITADASASGISADEVQKVLGILTDEEVAPTRSANTQGELMSLLSDDKDDITADVAAAAGVDRMKTSTILMLAAPFLLKYLLGSSGSNQSAGTSLLGSLLGGGNQSHANSLGTLGTMAALASLMGGSQQQSSQSSLLGSLLGMNQQPSYANANTNSLLGSLLGAGTPVQQNNMGSFLNLMSAAQPQQQAANPMDMGSLLSMMSAPQPAQPTQTVQQPVQPLQPVQTSQQSSGGGLLSALFNLLGDNG